MLYGLFTVLVAAVTGMMPAGQDRTIHQAVQEGDLAAVRAIGETLLSKGLDINRKDANGWTPLHVAVDAGRTAVVDLLLAKGADKHARKSIGQSAYNVAEDDDDRTMMAALAAGGLDRGPARFPELRGPYLGQKPPGKQSEVFAPGLVSGRYQPHSNIVFSPDGKEAIWSRMDRRAMVSRLVDGRFMLFSRDGDIPVSFRDDKGRWGPPVALGGTVNTEANEILPQVSPDGRFLFFHRPWKAYWVDASVIQDTRMRETI